MTNFVYREDPIRTEMVLGVDAQTAGEELDRIRKERGTLGPGAVVDESRPDEAPLHPVFEWCDPVAAEKYREHQATNLIRQVRVVVEPRPQREVVDRYELEQEQPLADLPADDFDPLSFDMSEAVGSLTETRRRLEALKAKAARRFDRKKVIAADIALNDLAAAEELLEDASGALTNARQQSRWKVAS
jgi:hypothetical protein